jgi:transcriptional regulator with XRE-family HTH domain
VPTREARRPRAIRSDQAPEVAERVGENLRRIRRREGLSQERLAVRASLHRTEVGKLERGERVCRSDTLIRLAGAMAIPPEELLDGIVWVPNTPPVGAFAFGTHGRRDRRQDLERVGSR